MTPIDVLLVGAGAFIAGGMNALAGGGTFFSFPAMLAAGVPPVVGFYAKLSVLWAVVEAGFVWLAVVAVMFSLIGAFYYLRIVKLMYFDAPQDLSPIASTAPMRVVLGLNGAAVLGFGIFPGMLMAICAYSVALSL